MKLKTGKQKKKKMLKKLYKLFSHDIGIDLGTVNTLVYVRDHGIVINEPSVVAVNRKTGQVVAVGSSAKQMIGRTPAHINAVRPLVDGVISDFEVTQEMLSYLIRRAGQVTAGKFIRPRVVVGVPTGTTNVERRAVRDAALNAGAREVHIVEEPMAAAIGIRLPVHDPIGNMVIDIGGGTTDVAVISLGGIVNSKSLKVAGDKFNDDIINYVRDEFKIILGEKTAEEVKIAICSVHKKPGEQMEAPVRGRDLVTGLPREVILTDADIREAIAGSMIALVDAIKEVIESTPPEIISDIMHRGVILVGGGATIQGLPELLTAELKVPIYIAADPLTAVVRGTGVILEDLEKFAQVLVEDENDLPPQ